jgi:zinc/manganese transport system substrate-binding protein
MKPVLKILIIGMLMLSSSGAFAALNILACEPEWAALAKEIGGDHVNTFSATTAFQDPHYIEAKPSLISRARNADLVACTGSELEIGWLPLLLSQSGNQKIQIGNPGYLEISGFVQRIEIPSRVDRSEGDVHPMGNPHVHLDPRNIAIAAEVLAKRLSDLDPANERDYQARNKAFQQKWKEAIKKWETDAKPLKGRNVIVHHKFFSYLLNWLSIREIGTLEPKPGMEPTASHLSELSVNQKVQPAKAVIYSSYNDPRGAKWLNEKTGVPMVMLPATIGGSDNAKDLFGLFDDSIQRLLQAAK